MSLLHDRGKVNGELCIFQPIITTDYRLGYVIWFQPMIDWFFIRLYNTWTFVMRTILTGAHKGWYIRDAITRAHTGSHCSLRGPILIQLFSKISQEIFLYSMLSCLILVLCTYVTFNLYGVCYQYTEQFNTKFPISITCRVVDKYSQTAAKCPILQRSGSSLNRKKQQSRLSKATAGDERLPPQTIIYILGFLWYLLKPAQVVLATFLQYSTVHALLYLLYLQRYSVPSLRNTMDTITYANIDLEDVDEIKFIFIKDINRIDVENLRVIGCFPGECLLQEQTTWCDNIYRLFTYCWTYW